MHAGATLLTTSPEAKLSVAQPGVQGRVGRDWAERPGLRSPAVLAASALHAALLAVFSLVLPAAPMPQPPAEAGVAVVFVPAEQGSPEAAQEVVASATVPRTASEVPGTIAALPPLAMARLEAGIAPPRRTSGSRHADSHTKQAAAPATMAVRAPAPDAVRAINGPARDTAIAAQGPASAPASPDSLHALANWEARIRQAVQDAAVYPASARLLHREGGAQIQFDYDHGVVERASVARSSESGVLDNAALAAVTRAALPGPPAGLGIQKRVMQVWVQFKLVATD